MGLFALITFLTVLIGSVLLARSLKNFMPSDKRLYRDLEALRAGMKEWPSELVPISAEELDAFSLNQEERLVRRRFGTFARGIFTTIYHEPVLAYRYKGYTGPGQKAILYAKTHDKDYSYIKDKKGVRIAAGQRQLGVLKEDGVLYAPNGKTAIAQLGQPANQLLPVQMNERELGSVVKENNAEESGLGRRAFQFVPDDLEEHERDVFLALATLELVHRSLES
mgnify:CR=1 FL=1